MIGVGARRECDEIISSGRVKVDGRQVHEPGRRVVPGVNDVSLNGTPLEKPPRPVVLLLNKPLGYVSTVTDPLGRPTILDLCKRYTRKRRLFPVGRLDINTTGAILVTNDGMLCYRLTHPSYEVRRIYDVRVRGLFDDRKLRRLTKLAASGSRRLESESSVELVKRLGMETILRITLREGQNRQVRRLCEGAGLRVVRLKRIQFGPVSIRRLPLGAVRPLEKAEVERLRRLTT
jgi:23S rRNA pseudouridine2605 synthase